MIYLSNLLQPFPRHAPISGIVTRKGLTTPLTRRVARICYLCAGAVYIVLLGSPFPWVVSLGIAGLGVDTVEWYASSIHG